MFDVLKNASFRNLWLANLLSIIGSQISRIGLVLYLFHFTQEVIEIAVLIALQTVPLAITAPLAGAVIDRFSKRRVMIAADLARMVLMLVALWHPSLTVIFTIAGLHSVASAFFGPAKLASIPLIVGKEKLDRANGVDQSSTHIMMILGPLIGAELFVVTGFRATLLVDALTFLISAALISQVLIRDSLESGRKRNPVIADIFEGWRYLRNNALILHLVILFFVSLLCVSLWLPLAPFFIRDFLGGSDRVLGLQTGVFGLGGMLGALWAPRLVRRVGRGMVIFGALLLEGLTMGVYSLVPDIAASVLILFLWGIVVSSIVVPYYSLMQQTIEERYLGRVFSVTKQSESIAVLLAMLAATVFAKALSADQIFFFAGLAYFTVIAVSGLTRGGRELIRAR